MGAASGLCCRAARVASLLIETFLMQIYKHGFQVILLSDVHVLLLLDKPRLRDVIATCVCDRCQIQQGAPRGQLTGL
jgi:hypothetical protein